MSIRAYRINSIELKRNNTFNFSHYYNEISPYADSEGDGQLDFEVERLKDLIANEELDENTKAEIQKDIEWAEEKGDTFISYQIF